MKTFALISLIFLSFLAVQAQDIHNNGALISIKSNTTLSSGEDFYNDGRVINRGTLLLHADWENQNNYETDGGEMVLAGEGQTIDHRGQALDILRLEGSGTKLLSSDLVVNRELQLESGILTSSDTGRLILANESEVIGGNDDAYVQGPVTTQGTGHKYYPLGLDGAFLPVELIDVTGADPEITFSVFAPNPNDQFNGSLNAISPDRYWEMVVSSGSVSESLIGLATYEEDFLENLDHAVVAESTSLNEQYTSLGQSDRFGDHLDGFVISDLPLTGRFFTIGLAPEISVEESITVINALSPNGDGIHDFLKIQNITAFPNNTLTIFNRWGDRVFEVKGYDNVNNVFEGFANVNGSNELIDGTYFYVVDKKDGSDTVSGYIEIRR